MLLSHEALLQMVSNGVITNVPEKHVNAASIDVTLGNKVLVPDTLRAGVEEKTLVLSLRDRTPMPTKEIDISGTSYIIKPGEFILAHTQEMFHLPNDVSMLFVLKSSAARMGLNHALAGWADAGWNNSVLTLELHNIGAFPIELHHGARIGQMIVFKHDAVSEGASYATRGNYNGDASVQATRMDWAKLVNAGGKNVKSKGA